MAPCLFVSGRYLQVTGLDMLSFGATLASVSPRIAAVLATLVLSSALSSARADEVSMNVLLERAARWAARLDEMVKRSSMRVEGYIESVDRSGQVRDRRSGIFRMHRPGTQYSHVEVYRYIEDGEDQTKEARENVAKEEKKRRKKPPDPDKELRMPFMESEQPEYTFQITEKDSADPSRVKVHFAPKEPAKNRLVGDAWVDTKTGAVLSVGASPSKLSFFVDFIHVTIELREPTSVGAAPSKIEFEGQGSFLFFRRKFRGAAVLSDYREPQVTVETDAASAAR